MTRAFVLRNFASAKTLIVAAGLACLAVVAVSALTSFSLSLPKFTSELKTAVFESAVVESISPKILQIRFVNAEHIPEADLHQAVGFQLGDTIWSANLATARESLTQLVWVRDVELHRSLDGTVTVNIIERTPCARHQKGGVIKIIDTQGVSLLQGKGAVQEFAHLPALVGQGAETGCAFWQEWNAEIATLNTELLAATRVRNRRWDLFLRDGLVIALPEDNWRRALSLLGDLERETGLVSYVRANRQADQTATIEPAGARNGAPERFDSATTRGGIAMSVILPLQFYDPKSAVAVLDIGTSKVACLIAEFADHGAPPRVLGFVRQPIFGTRRESVIDAQALGDCLLSALQETEQQAGLKPEQVFISFAGGLPESHLIEGAVTLPAGRVDDDAFARVLKAVEKLESATLETMPERALLHSVPVSYSVGDTGKINNPSGLHGNKFSLWMNLVTVERTTEQNLRLALSVLDDRAVRVLAAPWASALATLDEDEKELGAVVVDLGAEMTALAYVEEGQLLHMATLRAGGNAVTRALARRFSTTLEYAERAKVLQGHALPRVAMPHEAVDLPQVGGRGSASFRSIARSELLSVIHEETILRGVGECISSNAMMNRKDRGVVLVGGGALLPEVATLAEEILQRKVRLHSAPCPDKIPAWARGADYASIFGALLWVADQERALPLESSKQPTAVVRRPRREPRPLRLINRVFWCAQG